MATTKNKLVERYQTLVGSKAIEAIEPLILQSEAFIAKKNNVKQDDVTGILISAILDSNKKFPFPAVDVLLESDKKQVNQYIQFLWTYYDCPVNKKPVGIPKPKKKRLPKINPSSPNSPTKNDLDVEIEKPDVSISVSSQLVKKGDPVTITWKSTGADLVVDTDNFNIKDKKQVSGTTTIKNFNRSCTFEITVSNAKGTTTDSVDVELEEDDIISNLANEIKKGLQEKEQAKQVIVDRFGSSSFEKITDQLPVNLKKDKRVYRGMPLDFELDFDLACYVLVDSKEINSTDLPYLEWAKNVSGQEQDALIAHGKKVKKQVRIIGKEFKDLPFLHIPAVETDFKPKNPNKDSSTKKQNVIINAPSMGDKINDKSKKVLDIKNTDNPIVKLIEGIQRTIEGILNNLSGQSKDNKKIIVQSKREREKKRRLLKESLLETPGKFLVKATEKMLSPVKSIIDRIINFLVFALLGKALISLYEWSKDPKNKDKVDTIVRFLKDWWPTLLGAFILFGTGFGKMIRSSIGLIISATKNIALTIPKLIKWISRLGPRGKAIATVVATGAGAYAASKLNEPKPNVEQTTPPPPKQKQQKQAKSAGEFYSAPVRAAKGGGLITKIKSHPALGYSQPEKVNINEIAFANGGLIQQDSGVEITGAGKDTNLIAAQPGEVVISKSAVDYFGGPEFFLKLNSIGGGTNQPKFANNIQMQVGGGLVGSRINPLNSSSDQNQMLMTGGSTDKPLNIQLAKAPKVGPSKGQSNKKLTETFNLPAVNIATNKLKKDEALSSITKGRNDFIKPGGKSIISNTPWSSLKDSTPIHAYLDSQNVPTIGWGATFYDSIVNGKQQVNMGDVITKKQADNVFKMQLLDLSNYYSTKMKYWPMMTDNQRAGLLMTGFNAPNAPVGAYRKLSQALEMGDTKAAAEQLQRQGPNQERIDTEKKLLLSGPQNLRTAPNNLLNLKNKIENQSRQIKQPEGTNIFQSIKNQFNRLFNLNQEQTSTNIQPLAPRQPQIRPLQANVKTSFVTLPSMNVDGNNVILPKQKSTELPDFPSVSFATEERMFNASTYGIG